MSKPEELDPASAETATSEAGQRLDRWLWFVRAIKSRTQAAALVTDGKVRVNRLRVDKPSQTVRPGDVITVIIRGNVRVLRMLAPGARRGPPAEARTLFEEVLNAPRPSSSSAIISAEKPAPASDNAMSSPPPSAAPAERHRGSGRPTKRERRLTDRLRSR
jgi:ribosome-associated heat shock protein Hsp15